MSKDIITLEELSEEYVNTVAPPRPEITYDVLDTFMPTDKVLEIFKAIDATESIEDARKITGAWREAIENYEDNR